MFSNYTYKKQVFKLDYIWYQTADKGEPGAPLPPAPLHLVLERHVLRNSLISSRGFKRIRLHLIELATFSTVFGRTYWDLIQLLNALSSNSL